jgi:hypothetical protein
MTFVVVVKLQNGQAHEEKIECEMTFPHFIGQPPGGFSIL